VRWTANLIALAVLLAGAASAQPDTIRRAEDHLEPDGSVLGGGAFMADYDTMLRNVLHEAYERDVVLRMVAMPSFIPEYAIGLRGGKTIGKGDFKTVIAGPPYQIFGLSPVASVWTYQSIAMLKSGQTRMVGDNAQQLQKKEIERAQASVPANPRDLQVNQCEIGISDGLGDRITQVWRKMLMQTRYPQQYSGGADGATYHFSMFQRGVGDLSGHIWLPDRDSSTGTLVTLADEMYGICTKRKDASMDNLEKLTAELEHRLK
jgi:hypothetical protein